MKRSGVISWDLLLGMPDRLKQYVLLYDELWVPGINRSYPSADEIEEWDLDEDQFNLKNGKAALINFTGPFNGTMVLKASGSLINAIGENMFPDMI